MIPSQPVPFWQYFDLIVVSTLSVVVLWLLVIHKKGKGELLSSISRTIAADRRSKLIFSLVMTVCFPLYYGFLWLWVGPHTAAPLAFYILLAISFVSEMIFVWVPASSGKSKKIHEYAAGFVGLMMFIAPLLPLFAGQLSAIAELAVLVFTGASMIFGVLLLVSKLRKYALSYEVVYCVSFWILMSLIAHT